MAKKNPVRLFILILLATLSILPFQNCGQFKTQDLEVGTSETASATPPGGEEPASPVTPPPPAPPDYKSDVLARTGLKLGPKGTSTCQLQPPVIPDLDQPGDGTNVYKVCQDSRCPYQTIAAAVTAAPAGSVIAIQAATYNECVRISKDNITLQGRGGRPIIQSSDCPLSPWNKAIIGIAGNNATIENLELTDPSGDSVIGIGLSKAGANLNVNNVYFHHAQGGLYTVQAGDVVVTNSYFDHLGHMNGTDPHTVAAVTVGLNTLTAVVRNAVFTHPKQTGGMLGTSAHKNTLDCIVTADFEDGLSPYLMTFTYGFDVTVTNSVLQRGTLSIPQMLLYWYRNTEPVANQLTAKNNIFISDRPTRDRDIIVVMGTAVPMVFSKNVFIGPNSSSFSNFPESQSFESRAAAGLAADVLPYPGSTVTAP